MKSVDTKVLGRKTYEVSLRMGAKFDSQSRTIVFSRRPPPGDAPSGVEFVKDAIGPFTIDRFEDGVVQLHYRVPKQPSTAREPF